MVVLPAPLGPSRANASPFPMSRSTPSSTTLSPYVLRRPLTETVARVVRVVSAFMRHMLEPSPRANVKPPWRFSLLDCLRDCPPQDYRERSVEVGPCLGRECSPLPGPCDRM